MLGGPFLSPVLDPRWAGNDRGKSNILRNMGALVSGDLGKPLLDADALLIEDGLR